MNDSKTRSMLQRIPMILAVTAASYGLPVHSQPAEQARGAAKLALSRPAPAAQPGAESRLLKRR